MAKIKEKSILEIIREKHGQESMIRLGDKPATDLDVIPTGSISLDKALGIGGIARGRIIEIFGVESSGKTTLAQHIIKESQKQGGTCAFIDAEYSLDPAYSKKIGVNMDDLLLSQPDNGEEALEIVETLVKTNKVDVIVVDSVSALVPKAELEGDMGERHMGLQARLMSQAMRKLTGIIAKTNTLVIFINQIRYKIGVVYGNPEVRSGGNALKFYASTIFDMRPIAKIIKYKGTINEKVIGSRIRLKIVKNKVGSPHGKVEFDIMYNEGISKSGDVMDAGIKKGIIKKTASTYSFGEIKLGVGRENVKTFLKENENILKEIKTKIIC